MKKNIYVKKALFTVAVTLFLIAVGTAFTAVSALNKYTRMENAPCGQAITSPNSWVQDKSEIYIVKELDGFIAVLDESGDILKMTDIHTKTLPASDRELLKEGITVSEREELYEILSDYDT